MGVGLSKSIRKIRQVLLFLALIPLELLEEKEKERKLQDRLKRYQ